MTDIALGIQLAFVVFYGPPLTFMIGAAVAGAVVEAFFSIISDYTQKVRIEGRNDD
jgi:hypothetical protein